jgi:hypothetical protein
VAIEEEAGIGREESRAAGMMKPGLISLFATFGGLREK